MVRLTILPPVIAERLRLHAHIQSTHYSTRIEGNRLTLKEAGDVIQQGRLIPGREHDVNEVARYFQALQLVEKWAENKQEITEERIRKIHSALYSGKRARPTLYRDGQNIIRGEGGEIVYIPPEAKDVPDLMAELVDWIRRSSEDLPAPVIAGIVHYQFETIHPFYDGNGRTGRLLTTWILYRTGYDLGKFYALEEFYFQDLRSYYGALITHPHHNYYFGRNDAEITPWLEYFLKGMSVAFEQVERVVESQVGAGPDEKFMEMLRHLDHRARRVLGLFSGQDTIQSSEVANLLGVSPRQARELLSQWVGQGWLLVDDPSRKGRRYRLAEQYRAVIF
jgi:Fic family protein